jgi:hypothetical protein
MPAQQYGIATLQRSHALETSSATGLDFTSFVHIPMLMSSGIIPNWPMSRLALVAQQTQDTIIQDGQ